MEKNKTRINIMDTFRFYVFEVLVDYQTRWATSKDTLSDLNNFLDKYNTSDEEYYCLQYWTTDNKVFNLVESNNIQIIKDYCNKNKSR